MSAGTVKVTRIMAVIAVLGYVVFGFGKLIYGKVAGNNSVRSESADVKPYKHPGKLSECGNKFDSAVANGNLAEVRSQVAICGQKLVVYDDNWAIVAASKNGQARVVEFLLQNGADVRAMDDEALRWAVFNGHLEVAKMLMECGANIYALDFEAFRLVIQDPQNHPKIKILLEHEVYVKNVHDRAIFLAVINGDMYAVRTYAKDKAIVDSYDGMALRLAAWLGRTDIAELLLEFGVDVKGFAGGSSLWIASSQGNARLASALIKAGVDVKWRGNLSALNAARYGHVKVLEVLVEAGADISANYDEAICVAAHYGHAQAVKLLLEEGADPGACKKHWQNTFSVSSRMKRLMAGYRRGAQ